jgi:two-component system KDP operon response regulator KdpE
MLRSGSDIPVISLSPSNAEADKVAALDAGADDYVTRPFGVAELLARIRAALRRSPGCPVGGGLTFGGKNLEIDFATSRVRARGTYVRLTPMECKVLRCRVSHEGKPVSHCELLKAIWGPGYSELGPLRVLVNHIRKKIEQHPADPKYILTEPWVGYRFVGRVQT